MKLKMASDSDIHNMPLSMIPYKTRQILSCLLNSKKIFPSDEPDKLPRDWRGLASLVGISTQEADSIQQCRDKTDKVLDIWQKKGTPTVGKLLEYLQRLDRYDVHDDILDDLQQNVNKGELIDIGGPICKYEDRQVAVKRHEYATSDDVEGFEHHYDAFVLYADEDKDFIEEMLSKLGDMFNICTKDKLLPGHSTEYAPIAELISKRCQYIILVFSPAFLMSSANAFYRDYAQAVSIESRNRDFEHKLIPIKYKECELPLHLKYYYCLRYTNSSTFNFWDKLKQSLRQHIVVPRLQAASSHRSGLNIVEIPETTNLSTVFTTSDSNLLQVDRTSMNGQDSIDYQPDISAKSEISLNQSDSQNSEIVKAKKGLGRRFLKVLQRKKPKKEKIAVPLSH